MFPRRVRFTSPSAEGLPGSCRCLPCAPPPLTPAGPVSASARFFLTGDGLQPLRRVRHQRLCVTRLVRVHLRCGSHVRLGRLQRQGLPPPVAQWRRHFLRPAAAPLATCRTSDSHGGLLSAHWLRQTCLAHRSASGVERSGSPRPSPSSHRTGGFPASGVRSRASPRACTKSSAGPFTDHLNEADGRSRLAVWLS